MAGVFFCAPQRLPPELVAMEIRRQKAAERAEVYAPRPTGGPWLAGFCGAVVAMVVLYTIGQVYELPVRENLIIVAPLVVAAFGLGFDGYRRAKRKHRKAQARELRKDI